MYVCNGKWHIAHTVLKFRGNLLDTWTHSSTSGNCITVHLQGCLKLFHRLKCASVLLFC